MPHRQFAVIDFNSNEGRGLNNMTMHFKLSSGKLERDPRNDSTYKLTTWPQKMAEFSTREANAKHPNSPHGSFSPMENPILSPGNNNMQNYSNNYQMPQQNQNFVQYSPQHMHTQPQFQQSPQVNPIINNNNNNNNSQNQSNLGKMKISYLLN